MSVTRLHLNRLSTSMFLQRAAKVRRVLSWKEDRGRAEGDAAYLDVLASLEGQLLEEAATPTSQVVDDVGLKGAG